MKISVSKQGLTRCRGCGRHHFIDSSRSQAELTELRCEFCGGGVLLSDSPRLVTGGRAGALAASLMGTSLLISACDVSEETGSEAGMEMVPAGSSMAQPLYGAFPAGDEMLAGEPIAGEIVQAGEIMDQPLYGAFPAGNDSPEGGEAAGEMVGEMAGEMTQAGEDMAQPAYGAPSPEGGSEG